MGENRPLAGAGDLLWQVADGCSLRPADLAGIHLDLAGQNPAQGGLAGAIRPDQADALSSRDVPRQVAEHDLPAEGLADVLELDHGNRPRLGAAACGSVTARLSNARPKTILRECRQGKAGVLGLGFLVNERLGDPAIRSRALPSCPIARFPRQRRGCRF